MAKRTRRSTPSRKKRAASAARRSRKSVCSKKGAYACKALSPRCKLTKGTRKRKSFCRKVNNRKR